MRYRKWQVVLTLCATISAVLAFGELPEGTAKADVPQALIGKGPSAAAGGSHGLMVALVSGVVRPGCAWACSSADKLGMDSVR